MKKILTIAAILVLASSVGFAQIMLKGGLNMGTIGGDDAEAFGTPSYRTGFVAGAAFKLNLVVLTIQPEILYVQKGNVYKDVPLALLTGLPVAGTAKLTNKADYLEIPVLLKLSPLPLPVAKPYIEAGASYAILLGAKTQVEFEGESEEEDIKDSVAKSDLSLIVGAGVDLSLGVFGLNVDVRYVHGLTKLDKEGEGKVYNRGIQATVGLAL